MVNKKIFFVFAILAALIVSSFVYAEENDSVFNNEDKKSDVQLEVGAGITPDSPIYFIEDKILTQFRDDLGNREKKIAEIEEMIKEGKIDYAKKSLERYNKYTSKIGEDIDPEKSEEAKRSSDAIRNKMKEIEGDIPDENKKEFVGEIEDREEKISTAAELSKKIRDLCEALSKVDPEEYSRVCRTNDDSPKWQRNLDKKLTEEQRKEAEEFFGIMSQCFENPEQCKCEEIKIESFSNACSNIAPLAAECKDGNEEACEKMDDMEDPAELLPEHLRDVMQSIERKYSDSKFDNHFPEECRKEGANTREKCEKIMIRENAPEECIAALDAGKISFESPRQFQKACEEIMFKENAPEECIAAGLKDHKECGRYMFKLNAPEECIAAGLTGESPKDGRKCQEIMKSKESGDKGSGRGFALGRDCKSIQDKDEKLKCFEDMFNNAQDHYGFSGKGFEGGFDSNRGPPECKGITSREECEKIMMEKGKQRFEDTRKYQEDFARACREKNGRWDCSFGDISPGEACRCYFEDFRPPEGSAKQEQPREFQCPSGMTKKCEGDGCFCMPPEQQPPETQPAPTTTLPPTETSTTTTEQQTETGTSGSGSGSSTSTEGTSSTSTNSGGETTPVIGGTSGTTGSVIGNDNPFLDYYFGK